MEQSDKLSISAIVLVTALIIGFIVYVIIKEDNDVKPTSTIISNILHGGFMDYNNDSPSTDHEPDIWVTVPNNGEGAFTNKLYKPTRVTELMNSEGEIIPQELNLGDVLYVRNDFVITPQYNNSLLQSRYVLGQGLSEYTLPRPPVRLDDGAQSYRFSATTDSIYMGDTNTLDNNITFQVRVASPFTLDNNGSVIIVKKYNT